MENDSEKKHDKKKTTKPPKGFQRKIEEALLRRKTDPSFSGLAELFKALDARASAKRRSLEELRASSNDLTPIQRAERWLRFVLGDYESFADLEALVYLASRGHEHDRQTREIVCAWRDAEKRAIDQCARGNGSRLNADGTTTFFGGMSRMEAEDIENRSTYQLRNFWNDARGPHSAEATMLRVVEWCGITGFDRWWNRFVRETREDILLGGPDPEQLIWWLFDLCRCTYAIELLGNTLVRAAETVMVSRYLRRHPWVFGRDKDCGDGTREYVLSENLSYAAALAFCSTRLPTSEANKATVAEAIGTLEKHQLDVGAWAHTNDSAEPSIETTAMAVHAITSVGHPRSRQIASHATRWLVQQQDPAGYWVEESSPDPVRLTVLVLDALELASGGQQTTMLRLDRTPARPRSITPESERGDEGSRRKRFRVALSFPGELRESVERVANALARILGENKFFTTSIFNLISQLWTSTYTCNGSTRRMPTSLLSGLASLTAIRRGAELSGEPFARLLTLARMMKS
jgi:hypothetical protein